MFCVLGVLEGGGGGGGGGALEGMHFSQSKNARLLNLIKAWLSTHL